MTNIDAINSTHKNLWCHKKSWIAMKIVTPSYQMVCYVIITWKTELLLITKGQQYFQLANKED
jgi:hypothetical protein